MHICTTTSVDLHYSIDSGVEGYGLEMHVTRDQSAIDAHTECGMCFDLMCVTHYALDMRYICGTVAIIPGNPRAS